MRCPKCGVKTTDMNNHTRRFHPECLDTDSDDDPEDDPDVMIEEYIESDDSNSQQESTDSLDPEIKKRKEPLIKRKLASRGKLPQTSSPRKKIAQTKTTERSSSPALSSSSSSSSLHPTIQITAVSTYTRRRGEGCKPRRQCPKCPLTVINLARHMVYKHDMTREQALLYIKQNRDVMKGPGKTPYKRYRSCPEKNCGSKVKSLAQHMRVVHKLNPLQAREASLRARIDEHAGSVTDVPLKVRRNVNTGVKPKPKVLSVKSMHSVPEMGRVPSAARGAPRETSPTKESPELVVDLTSIPSPKTRNVASTASSPASAIPSSQATGVPLETSSPKLSPERVVHLPNIQSQKPRKVASTAFHSLKATRAPLETSSPKSSPERVVDLSIIQSQKPSKVALTETPPSTATAATLVTSALSPIHPIQATEPEPSPPPLVMDLSNIEWKEPLWVSSSSTIREPQKNPPPISLLEGILDLQNIQSQEPQRPASPAIATPPATEVPLGTSSLKSAQGLVMDGSHNQRPELHKLGSTPSGSTSQTAPPRSPIATFNKVACKHKPIPWWRRKSQQIHSWKQVKELVRFKEYLQGSQRNLTERDAEQKTAQIFQIWRSVDHQKLFRLTSISNADQICKRWLDKAIQNKRPGTIVAYLIALDEFWAYMCINRKLGTSLHFRLKTRKNQWRKNLSQLLKRRKMSLRAQDADELIPNNDFRIFKQSQLKKNVETYLSETVFVPISRESWNLAVGFLALEIAISNAQRCGAILGMTLKEVANRQQHEDKTVITVYNHKTGDKNPCRLVITKEIDDMINNLLRIRRLLPMQQKNALSPNAQVFLDFPGKEMTHSRLNKLIQLVWKRSGVESKITFTKIRKAVVTAVYEKKPESAQALAKHMTHLSSTAAQFYNVRESRERAVKTSTEICQLLDIDEPDLCKSPIPSTPTAATSYEFRENQEQLVGKSTKKRHFRNTDTTDPCKSSVPSTSSETREKRMKTSPGFCCQLLDIDGTDLCRSPVPSTSTPASTTNLPKSPALPAHSKMGRSADDSISVASSHKRRAFCKEDANLLQLLFINVIEDDGPILQAKIMEQLKDTAEGNALLAKLEPEFGASLQKKVSDRIRTFRKERKKRDYMN